MRVIFGIGVAAGALTLGIIATGCSTPVAPSAPPTVAAPTVVGAASGLSPADLEARGWDCRPSPVNPAVLSCSRPNQLHPVLLPGPPPPADRPASINLFVFENGVFVGISVLIRSDLYNGQPCSSTGNAYTFIARIGYYECRHQSQGD
jgi:hypothetical protein